MKEADREDSNWREKGGGVHFSGLLEIRSFLPTLRTNLPGVIMLASQSGKVILFATPLARLRQLGWQNLDLFRRVFPSFVSLFDHVRETAQMEFLLHEDTLTLACFPQGSSTPDQLVSLPVELENEDSVELVRSKLLSLVDVEKYSPAERVTIASEVVRMPDGYFEFDHHTMGQNLLLLSLPDKIKMSADELWCVDLRDPNFKQAEKNKRTRSRRRVEIYEFCTVSRAHSSFPLHCCWYRDSN